MDTHPVPSTGGAPVLDNRKTKTPEEFLKTAMSCDAVFFYTVYKIESKPRGGSKRIAAGCSDAVGTFHEFIRHIIPADKVHSYCPSRNDIKAGRLDLLCPRIGWVGDNLWRDNVGYPGPDYVRLYKSGVKNDADAYEAISEDLASYHESKPDYFRDKWGKADLEDAIYALGLACENRRAACSGFLIRYLLGLQNDCSSEYILKYKPREVTSDGYVYDVLDLEGSKKVPTRESGQGAVAGGSEKPSEPTARSLKADVGRFKYPGPGSKALSEGQRMQCYVEVAEAALRRARGVPGPEKVPFDWSPWIEV